MSAKRPKAPCHLGRAFLRITKAKRSRSTRAHAKKLPIAARRRRESRFEVVVLDHPRVSVSPFVEKHGIGWMEPSLVNDSVDKIVRYMGAAPIKDIKGLYTNEFIGKERLTPAQWKKVRAWSRRFLTSS